MKNIRWLLLANLLLALGSMGCNAKRGVITYIPTRITKEFLEQTNLHPIVPIRADLRKYQVIAIKKLDNLMLQEIPVEMYTYLNKQIVAEISRHNLFSTVAPIDYEEELEAKETAPRTLFLEGYVDDYNAGSRKLRVVELGLNHAVVTIRFQLRDRQTDEIVGSASVTVRERGATRTGKDAINKAARTVARFIEESWN